MKRIFTMLFALSLMITASSSYFSMDLQAAKKAKAPEATTEQFESEQSEKEEAPEVVNLPDTGASYNIHEYEDAPEITAASAILMDGRSGAILYGKEADTTRYPASITKVMTTLLAIENCKMSDIVTFSKTAVYGIEEGSSSAGIPVGAELTVEETLYALMLVSANEAGAAIAEHVAGSNEAFAEMMTQRAAELGCTGTQFKNPHGLPDEEHYTTAHDMGLIMKECIKHEEFRRISSTLTYTLESRPSMSQKIDMTNHAKILRSRFPEYFYEYAVGSKTGFTRAALNTLVTFAEKDGVQLICVILRDQGADCSYHDTKNLFEWGFKKVKTINPLENFDLAEALASNEEFKEKQVDTWLGLNPEFNPDYPILVDKNSKDEDFDVSFRLKEDLKEGRLGYVDLKINGEKVYSAPVTYDKSSAEAQTYQMQQGGDDNLKTADTKNNDSLLRKFAIFMLRLAIACILVFVIMQMIHRYQSEKKRQERIRARQRKNKVKGVGNSTNPPTKAYTSKNSTRKTPSSRSTTARKSAPKKSSSGSTGTSSGRSSGRSSSGKTSTYDRNRRPSNRKPRG